MQFDDSLSATSTPTPRHITLSTPPTIKTTRRHPAPNKDTAKRVCRTFCHDSSSILSLTRPLRTNRTTPILAWVGLLLFCGGCVKLNKKLKKMKKRAFVLSMPMGMRKINKKFEFQIYPPFFLEHASYGTFRKKCSKLLGKPEKSKSGADVESAPYLLFYPKSLEFWRVSLKF